MLLKILWVFIAMGSVLFLVVITTKYVGARTKRAMKGNYISVVETVSLGLDKQIHLLKVGEEFVLIATAGKGIQYLTNVKLHDYEAGETSQINGMFDFKVFFDKYLQGFKVKLNEKNDKKDKEKVLKAEPEGEVFKSNLSRLRSITSDMGKMDEKDGVDYTNES